MADDDQDTRWARYFAYWKDKWYVAAGGLLVVAVTPLVLLATGSVDLKRKLVDEPSLNEARQVLEAKAETLHETNAKMQGILDEELRKNADELEKASNEAAALRARMARNPLFSENNE